VKYSQFETLVLSVGTIAILGTLAVSNQGALVIEEVVGQILMLVVLFAAVHWGRNGGFIAAVLASVIYGVIRIPLVAQDGLTADIAMILIVRVLSYGLVGIVGGELCGRIRYIFAKLEDSSSVDDWSQVFNQRFITRAFESACGQFSRYQTPYSIIMIALADNLLEDLRPSKQRSLIRGVASYVRNDIRLVDEAGRLDDGRFLVLLPHTPREGALVVAERLHHGVCNVIGARDESVTIEVLGAPEDFDAMVSLRTALSAQTESGQPSVSCT